MDAPSAHFQVDADIVGEWRRGRARLTWKGGSACAVFQLLCAPSGRWCVDVFGKGVETQRGCWWRAAVPPCQWHWHVWSCLRAPGFKRMQELRLGSERATSEEAYKMNDVNSGAHWEKKISQHSWGPDEMKEITAEEDLVKMPQRCSKAGRNNEHNVHFKMVKGFLFLLSAAAQRHDIFHIYRRYK